MIDKFFKFFFICSCLLIFLFLGLYFEYLKIRFSKVRFDSYCIKLVRATFGAPGRKITEGNDH